MPPSSVDRIIILIDMDCFYCQVEEDLNPQLKGKPIAVVQYNQWQGGGLIAVNYLARDQGVTRHMRGAEAKEKCPDIQLVSVPTKRGKADTSRYRNAGKRVADVLLKFTSLLERASVDEAYLDITDKVNTQINTASSKLTADTLKNTHIVGFDSIHHFLEDAYDTELSNDVNLRLAIGAAMAEEIRSDVFDTTGYKCSAGIAHNKILAKLVCGLHKPNQQTVLPIDSVGELYTKTAVRKLQSMGGKFGLNVTEKLNIELMSDLVKFSRNDLRRHFDEKTSGWLYEIARGIEHTPVTVRLRCQSIGCCKKFPGPSALISIPDLQQWLDNLVDDLHERLAEDRAEYTRRSRHLVVNITYIAPNVLKTARKLKKNDELTLSRSVPMVADWETRAGNCTVNDVLTVLKKSGVLPTDSTHADSGGFSIRSIGLCAGKFEEIKNQASISSFLIKSSLGGKNLVKTNAILQKSTNDSLKTNDKCAVIKDNAINNAINQQNNQKSSKKCEINSENSFFINYFQNMQQKSSPSCSKDTKSTSPIINNINTIVSTELNTKNNNSESLKSICPDCNKSIGLEDAPSHSDYHYAVKLVQQESHMYNKTLPAANTCTKTDKNVKKRSLKRKNTSCKSIETFFVGKKEKLDVIECGECGKSVTDVEFETHNDFHVAERLFKDINGDDNGDFD